MPTHPTTEELQEKWWYRLLKTCFWIIIFLTAISPFIRESTNIPLDLSTGVLINGLIMMIVWKIIYYIKYGKKTRKGPPPVRWLSMFYIILAIVLFFTFVLYLKFIDVF